MNNSDKSSSSSNCGSVADEIDALRRDFPRVSIKSATPSFLAASYERTRYTRVQLTLTFPPDYPQHTLIVVVDGSSVVPPGLKKKLERELTKQADACGGRFEQVAAVFSHLTHFANTNRFLPCWKELRQSVDLIQSPQEQQPSYSGATGSRKTNTAGSTISVFEASGRLKLKLVGNRYFYACTITINEAYPETATIEEYGQPCRLEMTSTNFPPKIEAMLTSQARELVRRMQDGMTAEDALKMSNPVRAPKGVPQTDGREPVKVRLTQEALKSLKQDTDTLSNVRDLREVDAATVQGNAKMKAHTAKERKDARRTITKLTTSEREKDKALEDKDKEWQMKEKARMAGYNFSKYDGTDPQASLLSLVNFLCQKIQLLPEEVCPICLKTSLPANPEELSALYQKSSGGSEAEKKARKAARQKRPLRTFCGHWYHYDCLDKFMTEPPFGAACPAEGCGRRVFHPDWPDDIKVLERAWANQQARQREIEDAALFLG